MEIKDKRTTSVSTRKFDIDEEHRKLMKKLDIDNFSLSRIPRPETDEDAKAKPPTVKKLTSTASASIDGVVGGKT